MSQAKVHPQSEITTTRRISPVFAVLIALVPGLSIWLYGKRRQAATIVVAQIIALGLLLAFPSLPCWYLVSAIYIGQMVYSAVLSVWQSPGKAWSKAKTDRKITVPLPETIKLARRMEIAVFQTLLRAIRPDRDLTTAFLGLDIASSQYKFLGVTENDLVMANCTSSGDPKEITRFPKTDVAWVNLEIGNRNCLMTVRFEEERYPSLSLHIPSKLEEPAIKFIKEFPGAYDYVSPTSSQSIGQSADWKLVYAVTTLISLGFFILTFRIPELNSAFAVLKILTIASAFYIFGWPVVIELLLDIKNDPAITIGRILYIVFIVPIIFAIWGSGVLLLGMQVVKILQTIK